MNNRLDLCFDARETACNLGKARVKDIERAKGILRKPKKRGIELQFRNLENSKEATLVVYTDAMGKGETINKNPQEVCHEDNQLNNKRTAVNAAVLRRLVDMNNYISSKETSRHEHPQHYVEIADPPTKPGACRNWLRQALMPGQVDTRFQIRRVSKEPGTTNSHVRTGRHGVLVLLASRELGTSVRAKIYMSLNVTPRLQQVAGVLL